MFILRLSDAICLQIAKVAHFGCRCKYFASSLLFRLRYRLLIISICCIFASILKNAVLVLSFTLNSIDILRSLILVLKSQSYHL